MGRPVGLEPTNAGATNRCVNPFAMIAMELRFKIYGGADGIRTRDLLRDRQAC